MIQHTNAVKALARTVPAFASKTFVTVASRDAAGKLPKSPYLVIHAADGSDKQGRFTGPRADQNPSFTLHVVGDDYDQVASVTALLKAKFIPGGFGHVFTIPGEHCFPVWWDSPIAIQIDNDISPPLVYQVIELGFRSEPAA